MLFSKKIVLIKLYYCGVNHIYILYWLHFENVNWIYFLYIFHKFWLCLHIHLHILTKWYILSKRFELQSCSTRWYLLFDIHIVGGPGNVFNFSVGNSGEGRIKKNWLLIRTHLPRLPPKRSKKLKNSTMNN